MLAIKRCARVDKRPKRRETKLVAQLLTLRWCEQPLGTVLNALLPEGARERSSNRQPTHGETGRDDIGNLQPMNLVAERASPNRPGLAPPVPDTPVEGTRYRASESRRSQPPERNSSALPGAPDNAASGRRVGGFWVFVRVGGGRVDPASLGGWVTKEAIMADTVHTHALPAEIFQPEDPLLVSERVAVAAFLAGYSGGTRVSYTTDLRIFAGWCHGACQ